MGRITERSSCHLTDWQIVDAFPDECRKYYKLQHKIASVMLHDFFLNIERICEECPDDFERNFFVEMNWLFMPKRYRDMYKKSEKMLNMLKARRALKKEGKEDINIDLAKSQPIEGLYSFEKARRNRNHIISLCPFHNEDTPSFYVYLDDNKFHCYGCQAHGDAIDFVMKVSGLNFVEAVKYLIGG